MRGSQEIENSLSRPVMDQSAQGVLAFVEHLDSLQQQIDAGEVKLQRQAQVAADLDAQLAAAAEDLSKTKASLAKRVAERAKFAAKVEDYKAVLQRRAADSNTPLLASRRERQERLAGIDRDMASAVQQFAERCIEFRGIHDPAAVAERLHQSLTAVQHLVREASDSHQELLALQQAARQATEHRASTEARYKEVAAECEGQSLFPTPVMRSFSHPCACIGAMSSSA